jgi:hypothetical protein
VYVKDSVVAGDDLDRPDLILVFLENLRRQTDGVRARSSGDAVLDPDVSGASHRRQP